MSVIIIVRNSIFMPKHKYWYAISQKYSYFANWGQWGVPELNKLVEDMGWLVNKTATTV
jgi:hypothetical protein